MLGFMVPTTATLSLQRVSGDRGRIVERFRRALAEGDEKTAKNLLGSFEQLVQGTESPSELLTRKLNDWVSFLVLPLFALANAGVTFSGGAWRELLTSRIAWGILLGLVVGKPLGIIGFARLAVRTASGPTPQRRHLAPVERGRNSGGHRLHGLHFYQLAGVRRCFSYLAKRRRQCWRLHCWRECWGISPCVMRGRVKTSNRKALR